MLLAILVLFLELKQICDVENLGMLLNDDSVVWRAGRLFLVGKIFFLVDEFLHDNSI